jgi:hypothetical protein
MVIHRYAEWSGGPAVALSVSCLYEKHVPELNIFHFYSSHPRMSTTMPGEDHLIVKQNS